MARIIRSFRELVGETTSNEKVENTSTTYPSPIGWDSRIQDAVKIITNCATAIMKNWHSMSVVILGRDAWPVVPMLRSLGHRQTQYFLWSRLQYGDKATQELWLREVMPDSLVIDTGFRGSIIAQIKRIDRSVKGRLIHNTGCDYRAVACNHANCSVCDHNSDTYLSICEFEQMPKLTGRSNRADLGEEVDAPNWRRQEGGTYHCCQWQHDGDDERGSLPDEKDVVALNAAMLSQCGLSTYEVEKYKHFTGLTAKERLDMGPAERREHYRKVCHARRGYTPYAEAA